MRRRTLLRAGVGLATPLVAGCSRANTTCENVTRVTAPGPENAGTLDPDRIVTLNGSPCQAIVGVRFETVETHPTQGGKNRYYVEFGSDELSWLTGDQVFIQDYTCHLNGCQAIIETSPVLGARSKIEWVYDARTDVLKKGNKRYRPVSK